MPLFYYTWLAISDTHQVVIDVGFKEEVARQRKRIFERCPVSVLPSFGVRPEEVETVILTHLHYDHAGNLEKFPKAQFVLQEAEMAFWTGKYASRRVYRPLVEPEDVVHLVQENFKGRIRFVNGTADVLPGIRVYRTGGHSAGLQGVTLGTAKGRVVLAGDALHFYDNLYEDLPFVAIHRVDEMLYSFDLVRSLAEDPNLIVPGHDPLVMERFPAVKGLEGVAVQIA